MQDTEISEEVQDNDTHEFVDRKRSRPMSNDKVEEILGQSELDNLLCDILCYFVFYSL